MLICYTSPYSMKDSHKPRLIALVIFLLVIAAVNFRFIAQRQSEPSLQLYSSNRGNNEFRLSGVNIAPESIRKIINASGFNLLLLDDGRVFAGGSHNKGQLGVGAQEVVAGKLYAVPFPETVTITDIQAVDSHTIALDAQGGVWTWGLNISGQIGNNSHKNQNSPVKVLSDARAVTAGYRFSAAVKNDGSLWVWGMQCDQNNPELKMILQQFAANATAGGSYYGGVDVGDTQDCINEQNFPISSIVPRVVPDIPHVQSLSGGYGHLVWLDTAGEVWTWGCNAYGQLGREKAFNTEGARIPAKLTFPESTTFKAVSAGFRHSLAQAADGTVWIWGHNGAFEVSQETIDIVKDPIKAQIPPTSTRVTAAHDATAYVTPMQELYAVGENAVQRIKLSNDAIIPSYELVASNIEQFTLGRDSIVYTQRTPE